MYTTTSASLHLASWWRVTVLPVPKPPGIAAVPPFGIWKKVSMILCPVMSGSVIGSLVFTGLGCLTGHVWSIFISFLVPFVVSMIAMGSVTVYLPSFISIIFAFLMSCGIIILCVIASVSGTSPIMSPAVTVSPFFRVGVNSHFLVLSILSIFAPLCMNGPYLSHSFVSLNSSPSKISPSSPGPSSALSGSPVFIISSPGLSPLVSS